jgi:DNA-binding Lrp family transcriptional regulator
VIKKVHGQWALVGSHPPHRPLAYWHGQGRPSKAWVEKEERRVQYFKHLGEPWDARENPAAGDLHARIAAALNWPMRDVQSMSLQSLRDLVRPVDPALADEISRKVQSAGHYVHTGVEVSPTERQILDFMLTDAMDVDIGNFSRTSTKEIAEHFKITPEVAFKRLDALAKRGVLSKTRDTMKKHRGAHAVGWQFWEYGWKDGDEARAERIEAARRNPIDPPVPVVEPICKPGPYGELLRYTVFFRDPGKPAFDREETWGTWAYSIEHAVDLFHETHDGFKVVRTQLEVLSPEAR